ncbi:hypothetical protein [Catellatospora sp. NPDC049609]|uniref:hypothetical protein n=1 Tax=Catellatospora sp. NPDC049609 TaxID=3155505 RepID=UPI00341F9116
MPTLLPSWRPGAARDAILGFLAEAERLPERRRVAVLDHDGTMCCERPVQMQFAFFLHEMRTRMAAEPALAERADYRLLMEGDPAALSDFGLRRIALVLNDLVAGLTPEEFTERVLAFMDTAAHPVWGVPFGDLVYQPMRELVEALRAHGFAVFLSTLSGIEFLRAISPGLYGVPPEGVVGAQAAYRYDDRGGRPALVRISETMPELNEGPTQVLNLQRQLGRRPVFVAANSPGDRAMIEYALAGDGPAMALVIDHDDDVREYAYVPQAMTFSEPEPVVDAARRLGWTVASMRDDWATVFAPGVR